MQMFLSQQHEDITHLILAHDSGIFLIEKAQSGIICSVDKVLKEIQQGEKDDPLKKWSEGEFKKYFFSTDNNEILESYKDIINFVSKNNQYLQNAIDDFLQENNADAWVIAFAKRYNIIVVTEEKSNPKKRTKVYILDICKYFDIKSINSFEMLKDLGFKL